jgi:hypothetical protein
MLDITVGEVLEWAFGRPCVAEKTDLEIRPTAEACNQPVAVITFHFTPAVAMG